MAALAAPRLASAGRVDFDSVELPALELPGLETAGEVQIRSAVALERVSLPQLGSIRAGLRITESRSLATVSMPALQTIGKEISIFGNPRLASLVGFAKLESVERLVIVNNQAMVDLSGLAALRVVRGTSDIRGLPIRRLGLPALRLISGLFVEDVPALETLDAPWLHEVDAVQLIDAPVATRYDLPALRVIGSKFTTATSARMPKCRADALLAQLDAPPATVDIRDTDEAAPCE